MANKLEVGQKLWYVPHYRGEACFVTVTKVGRVWASIDGLHYNARIGVDSLIVDGRDGYSPGRCYISRARCDLEKATKEAWEHLRRATAGDAPAALREKAAALIEEVASEITNAHAKRAEGKQGQ